MRPKHIAQLLRFVADFGHRRPDAAKDLLHSIADDLEGQENWPETGPENSREEFAPRLFGGDCMDMRVAPA